MTIRAVLGPLIPLLLAITLIGASFGTVAVAAGLSLPKIVALSAIVYAGGAQFLVVASVAAGAAAPAILVGGMLLNARHLPYGLVLSDIFVGSGWTRVIGAHLMTDEATAYTVAQWSKSGDVAVARRIFFVAGAALFTAWNLGTLVGALGGDLIADPANFGVDAAFPAAILALTAGALRLRVDRRVAVLGAGIAVIATPVLPAGVGVLAGLIGLVAIRRSELDQESA